jgi:hypothetical protein
MIRIILYLLEKIPYRTRFGLSLADELKYLYYYKIGQYKIPPKCLCGGRIRIYGGSYPDGYTIECDECQLLIDED